MGIRTLTNCSRKNKQSQKFIQDIRQYTEVIIQEINESQATYKHDNLTTKNVLNVVNHFLKSMEKG